MVLCGTGHRPQSLTSFGGSIYERAELTQLEQRLRDCARAYLTWLEPTKVVTGMALGWDTALAEAAVMVGVPLVATVPFVGQERRWSEAAQVRFHDLLASCAEVIYVSEGPYAAHKMQLRNAYMVEHSDRVLALWNGTPGGTGHCVRYAQGSGTRVTNLWTTFTRHAGLPFLRRNLP